MTNEKSDFDNNDQLRAQQLERDWHKAQNDAEKEGISKSRKVFEETEAYQAKQREIIKKRSAADKSFTDAVELAMNQIKDNKLEGEIRPDYEVRYTVAQGIKAAVHGREDGIATLVLQRDILIRLDAIKSLLWIAIALLLFIAYRLLSNLVG